LIAYISNPTLNYTEYMAEDGTGSNATWILKCRIIMKVLTEIVWSRTLKQF
jgi:hypothetical protein